MEVWRQVLYWVWQKGRVWGWNFELWKVWKLNAKSKKSEIRVVFGNKMSEILYCAEVMRERLKVRQTWKNTLDDHVLGSTWALVFTFFKLFELVCILIYIVVGLKMFPLLNFFQETSIAKYTCLVWLSVPGAGFWS